MVDPLTALGLAGNIAQFVQFGISLYTSSQDVYRSATGATDNNALLATIAKDAWDLCEAITASTPSDGPVPLFADLAKTLALELLEALEKLRIQGKHRKWSSFRTALKTVWTEKEIHGYYERIVKLQTQLCMRMQFQMLSTLSDIGTEIANIAEQNRKFNVRNREEIGQLMARVSDQFRSAADESSSNAGVSTLLVPFAPDDQDHEQSAPGSEASEELKLYSAHCGELAVSVKKLEAAARVSRSNGAVLASLYFEQFQSRHQHVSRSHAKTFDWIYDPNPSVTHSCAFLSWLCEHDGFFWVQGKAGSGKSTLMKFLYNDYRTAQGLRNWSNGGPVVTANFFFWRSGSPMQRSQTGLLRSLLFEILRNCPELIPSINHIYSSAAGWDVETMIFAFKEILSHLNSTKFCFFIDGLDEYEDEQRTPADLIKTLRVLASSSNVKICVSSRPWMVFEDAFGDSDERFLKLEDLTAGDIEKYVTDKLVEHTQFAVLEKGNGEMASLVKAVVSKAQGVFLWVYLVVRDLLEGLTYHDTLKTLYRRLESFPPDLEDYFRHMFHSIPKFYRRETAQVFLTALAARQPLLAITYSFWEEITDDPDWAIRLPHAPFEDGEIDRRIELTRRRLDGQCKGLLEVVTHDESQVSFRRYRVDFMHRTVRDFINDDSEVQMMTQSQISQDRGYILELDVCRCLLATMKAAPKLPAGRRGPRSFPGSHVRNIHHFANKVESALCKVAVRNQLFEILDSAEDTFVAMTITRHGPPVPDEPDYFLGEACVSGVLSYVEYRLAHQTRPYRLAVSSGRPLLEYALEPAEHSPCPTPAMIKLLLEHGAQPNMMYKDATIWQHFASRLYWRVLPTESSALHEVVFLLIAYGANVDHRFPVNPVKALAVAGGRNFEWEAGGSRTNYELKSAREIIESRLDEGSMLIMRALDERKIKKAPAAAKGRDESSMRNALVYGRKMSEPSQDHSGEGREQSANFGEPRWSACPNSVPPSDETDGPSTLRSGRTLRMRPIPEAYSTEEEESRKTMQEPDKIEARVSQSSTRPIWPLSPTTTITNSRRLKWPTKPPVVGSIAEVRVSPKRRSWLHRLSRSGETKDILS